MVENALVATVCIVCVADGFAVDGNGVRLVSGGDRGWCAGLVGRLIGRHCAALPVDSCGNWPWWRASPQPGGRHRWGGQSADRAPVSFDYAEALIGALPLLAIAHDLVVAAPDEVPPHQQLFGERGAPQQHHPRRLIPNVAQAQRGASWALVPQVGDGQGGSGHRPNLDGA